MKNFRRWLSIGGALLALCFGAPAFADASWSCLGSLNYGSSGGLSIAGSGVPSVNIGCVNDTYIDYTNSMVYGPKTAAGWGSGHSLGSSSPGGVLPANVQGDIFYSSATNTVTVLNKSAATTRYLANTGTSNNPAWAQVSLVNGVTGALAAANFPALTGECVTTAGSLNVTCLQFANLTGNISMAAAATVTSGGRPLTISAGAGGSTSGAGGQLTFNGGSSTSGAGGGLFFAGANGTGTNSAGGSVTINSGNGHGTQPAGSFNFSGGTGGATGDGGGFTMNAGNGGSSTGSGGGATLQGGSAGGTAGAGGDISIAGGDGGSSTGGGGGVTLAGGSSSDAATGGGAVTIAPGAGPSVATSGSVFFVDPNTSGNTFVIDQFDNLLLSCKGSTATTDTDGFAYLPAVAGVPTGVPAHLTGAYATTRPLRYDTSDNRLYAYNGGWQNLTGGSPAGANTQIQFNSSSAFGASAALTWTTATNTLTVGDTTTAPNIIAPARVFSGFGVNLSIAGGANSGSGSVGGTVTVAGGAGNAGANAILIGGVGAASAGGTAHIVGGTGVTAGGTVLANGGTGGTTGVGGSATLQGGAGGSSSGNGGDAIIAGGIANSGTNGAVHVQTNNTDRLVVDPTGTWLIGGSAGTSGNTIVSAGPGVAPAWGSVSGGNTVRQAVKTADTARTSTVTAAIDPDLQITSVVAGLYSVNAYLPFQFAGAGTTPGARVAIVDSVTPTATSRFSIWCGENGGQNAQTPAVGGGDIATTAASVAGIGLDSPAACTVTGTVRVASSSTVSVFWAQNASSATATTLQAGAWLRIEKLN